MCRDTDLFGQVVITYEDVEIWLKTIPRLHEGNRINQVQTYINSYNVVSKILQAKLDNSFYCLNRDTDDDKPDLLKLIRACFKPKFHHVSQRPPSMR